VRVQGVSTLFFSPCFGPPYELARDDEWGTKGGDGTRRTAADDRPSVPTL
jgi:hypothetical protein